MPSTAREVADRFEAGQMNPADFDHRAHVIAGWAMLECYPVLEAITRFATGLRAFATAAGDADKYNATITVAFIALIAERMHGAEYRDGDDFCDRNPDVLQSSILERYYTREALRADESRAAFVIPDRPVARSPR